MHMLLIGDNSKVSASTFAGKEVIKNRLLFSVVMVK
jgi:hypothetical protein